MRVLITGICGFVGSTLAKGFAELNLATEIIGIDNFSRAGSELNRRPLKELGINVISGDIRCASDVESLPAVDWVIDAAAIPSVLAGIDGKTSSRQLVEHNLLGTINLCEYCKRHNAGFVLLSTSRVYSIAPLAEIPMLVKNKAFEPDFSSNLLPAGISQFGVSEQFSTVPPVSLYGSTKVASEHLVLEYSSSFGFPAWINRCGVMAGAGQFGHPAQGIFAYWIHSFRERKPLKYIGFGGTGYQVRDCLHPRDLVYLLREQFVTPQSSDANCDRVFNVGGGIQSSISLAQLTEWCENRFGPMTIVSDTISRRFDIPWMVLDVTEVHKKWSGWKRDTSIADILEEIAEFSLDNPTWLVSSA